MDIKNDGTNMLNDFTEEDLESIYIIDSNNIKIIETNLIPSRKLSNNVVNCAIIIDSTGNLLGDDIYQLNQLHKEQGHSMFTHNYFISKKGQIFRGRNEEYRPYIDEKFGLNCVGIMLEGDFNKEEMNDLQFNNLMYLIYDIKARNPFIEDSVYIHSELNEEYSNSPGKMFPYVDFRNRLYRNFISITDTTENIELDTVHKYGTRDLEYKIPNMAGIDVYQLKMLLIKLGYTINNVNGIYDEELREVLSRYFNEFHIRRESYYSTIITQKDLNELEAYVMNLIFDRGQCYRRYLKVKEPLMFGDDIYNIKDKLWILGLYEGEINNIYDQELANAVKLFERRYGIYANGEVGPLVYREILKSEDYSFKRVLELQEPMMEGSDVKIIQKALYRLGYNVDINSFYDLKTYNAVCSFQIANNIIVDGRIDQYMFNTILKYYKDLN